MQQAGQGAPEALPILEINPQHPLVARLEGHAHFDDLAHLIFDHAVLAEGGQLQRPAEHVQRMMRVLTA
jgi:molecular chaperone HtpG